MPRWRGLTVAAVVATGLVPVVLVAGALLRRGGVAAAYDSAPLLRRALLAHGIPCDGDEDVTPAPGSAASALTCSGPEGVPMRLLVYGSEAARESVPHSGVEGANWRVEVAGADVQARIAKALNGHAYPSATPG